jgi:hypothetical protein
MVKTITTVQYNPRQMQKEVLPRTTLNDFNTNFLSTIYSDLKKDSFSKFDSTCASLEVLFGRWKNDIVEKSKEDLMSELNYPPKFIQADEEDRRQQREIDREGFKRRCAQEDEDQIAKRIREDLEAQNLQLGIEERKKMIEYIESKSK